MMIYKIITIALCAFFIIGCGGAQPRTPTETLKALNEASKKRDVPAIKKLLSKGTLALLEESAKTKNKSSDELLKEEGGAPFKELPDIRGETIEGDTAFVDVKNEITGETERIPLVKEEGEWKVALDKYLEDLMKRWTEQMKSVQPNSNIAPSNSNQTNTNKPKTNQNSAVNEEFKSVQNRLRNSK